MKMVIDKHMESDNVRVWQDEFIDILILQRESMYNRFISTKTKNNGLSADIGLIEKMQKEIKNLYIEKYDLKKLNISLKKIVISKDELLKKLVKENDELRNNVLELENELEGLKNNTFERQNNINSYDNRSILSDRGSMIEDKPNDSQNNLKGYEVETARDSQNNIEESNKEQSMEESKKESLDTADSKEDNILKLDDIDDIDGNNWAF